MEGLSEDAHNSSTVMASMLAPAPAFEVVHISGPLIIILFMDAVLFGALTVQLYLYYEAFPNDVLSNKSLVYTIYILNLGMTILYFQRAFATFGFGFSNISALTTDRVGGIVLPFLGGLVAFLAQSFYAYRIHVLSKTRVIPCCIVIISLAGCVGSILLVASPFMEGASQGHYRPSITIGVWCGASALCDIIIAVCMTYYLTKINTELRHLRAWLSKLTRLTIETGSLTAVVALVAITLWLVFPHDIYYFCAGSTLPKFYGYSVLVVLNSRIEIVGSRGSRGTHPATTSQIIAAVSLPQFTRDTRATIDREDTPIGAITREASSNVESDNRGEMKVMGPHRILGSDASV
ncbi:hypothetical protein B0H13DRAFT_2665952 [Mycena leptocephala]|nr:hypothetical protein B0H13DRAFT_2665952 [Mycena leptocephala]